MVGLAALIGALEIALLSALARTESTPAPEPSPPIFVSLIDPPTPPPPQEPEPEPEIAPTAGQPAPDDTAPTIRPPSAPPPPVREPRIPPPPTVETVAVTPAPPSLPLLTSAQTAGALRAGSGSGGGSGGLGSGGEGGSGGGCDMLQRLQDALRDDTRIRALVTQTHRSLNASGRSIQVWDGQWLQSPGEAGRGLAGVRQAIALEVGFAPRECREQSMRGLVLIAFDDDTNSPRLALGAAAWRWSDLLELDRARR